MRRADDDEPLVISPVNWRITWMILAFVGLSLAAAVLPLWPAIRGTVPLEFLSRRDAMCVYACFLLGFMLFLFPLFVRKPESGAGVRPWWWVGGFVLAFSGAPLFVLAYIAGVHLDGVFAVLLWGGIIHGGVLVLLRVLRYRARVVILVLGFLLAVVLPGVGYFRQLLMGGPLLPSPFTTVVDITRNYADPGLVAPAAVLAVIWGLLLLGVGRRPAAAALLLASVVGAAVLGAATPPPPPGGVTFATTGWVVPGQPVPVRLEASEPGVTFEVDVAGREVYHWTSPPGGARQQWIYPAILGPGEALRVRVAGRAVEGLPPMRLLAGDRTLVLDVVPPGGAALDASVSAGWRAETVSLSPEGLPESELGYRAFGAIVTTEDLYARLASPVRRAIDAAVGSGGALVLLGASADSSVAHGAGRVVRATGARPPSGFRPPSRHGHRLEDNLYSRFALPDWGRVDLTGLILFLVVYHVVFFLIFLLPLLYDAKKSMTVYLVSVGFVLALELVGAYFAITQIFLKETQILQQNLAVCLYAPGGSGAGRVRHEQVTCFASYNEQPARLTLDTKDSPWLLHEDAGHGAGDIEVAADGSSLTLGAVRLDRFRRKQMVRFSRDLPAPFRVERDGRRVRLRHVPGVADSTGLWTARRLGAFVRHEGRLHAVTVAGSDLVVERQPDPRGWQGVLAADLRSGDVVPFLRYALGRLAPSSPTLLVLLLDGVVSIHEDADYLHTRDIAQLLIIPLDALN